ncbi:MAG: DUF456 domain-containing protein [Ardenticatenales bacterium]|nr:DUF456 domain-containing protein [Ardenticatenales bacterium]
MHPLDIVAALLILAGLLGAILPALPSTPLIFAGALLYDWVHEWQFFGWEWLAVLFLLMILAMVGDWWLGNLGAKKGGASWQAMLVGMVLGTVGLFMLPPFGLLIGSLVGIVGTEMIRARHAGKALRAGGGWLAGWLLSLLLQGTIAVLMVGLILWQAS